MADLSEIFTTTPDDDALRAQLREWQDEVFQRLRAKGKVAEPALRFGGTIPLHLLDPQDRIELMGQYRKIIGLDTALWRLAETPTDKTFRFLQEDYGDELSKPLSNIWGNLNTYLGAQGSRYANFPGSGGDTLLGRIYSSLNIQLNLTNRSTQTGMVAPGASPTQFFTIGSIPRLENVDRPVSPDYRGKSVFLFDLETAGFRPGSIRELGYETFRFDLQGDVVEDTLQRDTLRFRPIQGTRGSQYLSDTGQIVNTDELFDNAGGLLPSSSGDDFLDRIVPVLRKASEADLVVGHNIETFDLNNLFESISKTKRYQTDVNFQKEINEMYDKISGKTFDTLRAVREAPNLQGLRVSRFLGSEASPRSISNLLLSTDLAKRIGIEELAAAMGYDPKTGLIKTGLHSADVDALLTRGIMQHLPDLKQVTLMQSGLTAEQKKIARIIRRTVMDSAAITPFTDIRDPTQIHRRVYDLLSQDGEVPKVNRIEHEILEQRRLELGATQHAVDSAVRGIPSRDLLPGLGAFDRMIGRQSGTPWADVYDTIQKPSTAQFAAYQEDLAARNMPFAGLSYEERLFGTALSDITNRAAANGPGGLLRETLTSRWQLFDPTAIQYVTSGSGKITLPIQVLKEAGLLDDVSRPALFGLSVVEPTKAQAQRSINLAYELQDDSTNKIATVLQDMLDGGESRFAEIMEITDREPSYVQEAFERFRVAMAGSGEAEDANRVAGLIERLRDASTRRYGVSVAQLQQGDAVSEIVDLLNAVNNTDRLNDRNRIKFRLAFGRMESDAVITSGAVLDRGLTGALADLGRQVQIGMAVTDTSTARPRGTGFTGIRDNARMGQTARAIDSNAMMSEATLRGFNFVQDRVIPNVPRIGLGIAAFGIGAYLYNRKRRNDRYDIDFQYEGPAEGPSRYAVADVLQARIDAGYNGARRQVDPLATASLVDHLYYSSVGHTNMSWDRNQNIYGGVL